MPFKDPERKRQYQTEYKARLREARTQAQSPLVRKIYFCSRYPSLKLGPAVTFRNSFFVTGDPEKQRFIEGCLEYGRLIVSWSVDPSAGDKEFIL